MQKFVGLFTNNYLYWTIFGIVLAYFVPATFDWMNADCVFVSIFIVMLSMGINIEVKDLKNILKMPKNIIIGTVLKFAIMPMLALGIALAMGLNNELVVGFVLLGSCPGGMASNLVTYISKADLVLSILLTSVSTFLAIFTIPFFCEVLVGQIVEVDALSLISSVFKSVLLPVVIGALIRYFVPKTAENLKLPGSFVSVWAIIFITGFAITKNIETIKENFAILILASFIFHLGGFIFGYIFSKLITKNEIISRTVSIETGMQNGGLAMGLALRNFAVMPMAVLPATFCCITQSIISSFLASYWRKRLPKEEEK